jgi:hypothetical protein
MSKTRRELVDKVLDNLGILVPGQAPGDESVSKVDGIIDPGAAMLAALGIVYLPDMGLANPPTDGEIDDAVFLPLAAWMAWQAAPAFNLGDSPSLKALADQAEETLRIIGRPASTRRVLTTDGQLRGSRTRSSAGNFTRGT